MQLFEFELPDPFRPDRWRLARWKATSDEIARLGGRVREGSRPEIRIAGGGQAGHLQSSPRPSETLPTNSFDDTELERSGLGGGSGLAGGALTQLVTRDPPQASKPRED